MAKKISQTKSRTYRSSKNNNSLLKLLKNKWIVIGLILVVAIAGIIAIRASQAAGLSGRMPESGEPHIDYTFNPLNGTVTLKKSTNGQTRVAPNIDEAYVIGQQMYDEMIAAQTQPPSPAPSPIPAPSPTPAPSTGNFAGSSSGSSSGTSSNSGSGTTSNSAGSTNGSSSSNTSTTTQSSGSNSVAGNSTSSTQAKQKLIFTLRRTVELVPKLPTDTTQVASVHYLIDGKEIDSSTKTPFSIEFNTRNYSNGSHKVTTSVLGKNGKVITANSYNIIIDNAENPFGKLLEILGW